MVYCFNLRKGGETVSGPKRQLCVGLLAHVDAGKTTLSEAMLYLSGALRKAGRVDHGDAFLDSDRRERERGITIFSKQARLRWDDCEITLLDTPGHVDFSAETERTLSVLDCAVLLVSGSDGVQGHTRTLWKLLEQYGVPTFVFVNKMDLPGTDRTALLAELRKRLGEGCADFSGAEWAEQAATESEEAMEAFLATGEVPPELLRPLIAARQIFPCCFGAALRMEGAAELLDLLVRYASQRPPKQQPAARVYKISRDPQGNRLTWLRVTGGELRARQTVGGVDREGRPWEEKINQIRLYSGDKYEPVDSVPAGTVCAVTGLTVPGAGDGLGAERGALGAVLESLFTYGVTCTGADPFTVLQKLRVLQEEDPQLRVSWDETLREVRVHLMGPVQLEILKDVARERFGLELDFDRGSLLYRETIADTVEGVGHYEPLRHYAEVHLILSPGARDSGLVFDSACSQDELDLNWQRLILTHLKEKEHRGVLTGAPITDLRITLAAGRAHLKHTEGGDFREATYRAVRQGLMRAQSVLLEPWYSVRIELPAASAGRAMTDLQRMGGSFDPPETVGEETALTGEAPVAELRDYQRELTVYTRGTGRMFCTFCGYRPCRDAEAVIAASAYDPERDTANSPDSVFCSHGAGYVVPWNEVETHMHLPSCLRPEKEPELPAAPAPRRAALSGAAMDKELQAIFERTYGPVKERSLVPSAERRRRESYRPKAAPVPEGPEYLLVDGYNIIYAWDELHAVAEDHLDAARQQLMDRMSNYQALRGCELILVFDAYRVPDHPEEVLRWHNIHVVYTRTAETADAYIEKTAHEIAKNHRVRVASSDNLEQLIILGQGALRVSAGAFHEEVALVESELRGMVGRTNLPDLRRPVAEALEKAEEDR